MTDKLIKLNIYHCTKTHSHPTFSPLASIEASAQVHSRGLGHGGDENRTRNDGECRQCRSKSHDKLHDSVRTRGPLLRVSAAVSPEEQRQQLDLPWIFSLQYERQPELRADDDRSSSSCCVRSCRVRSCRHFYRHAGSTRLRTTFEPEGRFEDHSLVR